ncbi:MAG: 3-keto-5-aminohexanoate cleavage protein [Sporichthyaceae bacterium]|nr:3-keto-5-aminohexanoate cleavage protein [Sporichthyaceae bacterium]
MIKACLNGGRACPDHARVPLTPEALAADTAACADAGAGAVHVHPRDGSGRETLDAGAVDADADAALASAHAVIAALPAGGPPMLLHGDGGCCWPVLREALRLGLDTRIGLEDTLVMPDGFPAPGNAALVVAATGI